MPTRQSRSRRGTRTPTTPADSDGFSALVRGEWEVALETFQALPALNADPHALEGLALAAWWLDRADLVFDSRERAYRLYREGDDAEGAARMAVWLAWDTAAFRGEPAIARGWLQRADRLLTAHPPSTTHAFLALRRGIFALLEDGDTAEAEQLATAAIAVGQALGAIDYELTGRALHGFARVSAGHVVDGLRELD